MVFAPDVLHLGPHMATVLITAHSVFLWMGHVIPVYAA